VADCTLKTAPCRRVPLHRVFLSLLLASLGLPPPDEAVAQRQRNEQEFTRQLLLIAPFAPDSGTELQLGRRVADGLRSRLNDMLPGREVELARNDSVRARLIRAGFSPDSVRLMATAWQLGRSLRADEVVVGTVASTPDGFRVTARMALARDLRLVQPLPVVEERTLGDAVRRMAQNVADARKQLVHHRRCENFMREGRYADAMRSARAGIAEYRQGAIVRTCLTLALRHGGGSARDLLASARDVLAIDPESAHALEAAGIALDTMQAREEAAEMWTRLFATDTSNLERGERVVWALHENGNSPAAEPLILKLSGMHPSVTRLFHLQWRIANSNRNRELAISTGEELLKRLPDMALDSAFVTRLAAVYETDGQRFKAIATAARGVADIPDAAQLYALYTRLVRTEADTVLPRGLALFPRSAELLAMNAEALRAEGRLVEALTALRHAVDLDPTLPQGELTVAQAEFDLGRPDSSLASLRRVVSRLRGEEAVSGTVAGGSSSTPYTSGTLGPDASVRRFTPRPA
jgi:tetratricopeptide (TPR) repeat protein